MNTQQIAAYGLDYIRFRIFSDLDLEYIQREIEYLDVTSCWHHGSRYVDLTGGQLEIIRLVDDIEEVILNLAYRYPVNRIDVFVDIEGDVMGDVKALGTEIRNGGVTETIYSHHLKERGDRPAFCRAYNATRAGHYERPVTRFECEFKKDTARGMLTSDGWKVNPVAVALHVFRLLLGVKIWIDDIKPLEFQAPKRKLQHSRERFYTRYGKGIFADIEKMGVQGLRDFIVKCIREKEYSSE